MLQKVFYVGGVIIVVAAISLFYRSMDQKAQEEALKLQAKTVINVAQGYYNAYSTCMQKPPKAAKGQVGNYCPIHNPYASPQLEKNLAAQTKKGYTLVLCAQNIPQSVSPTGEPKIAGNEATMKMKEQFGSNSVIVTYVLKQEKGQWKVNDVRCPKPEN